MGNRCLFWVVAWLPVASAAASPPVDLGDRRELLVDGWIVQRLEGQAVLRLNRPEPREVVLVTDAPWEGNTCAYYTVFQDGDRYRMYYRGSHFDEKVRRAAHREVTCYAESKDGIHWEKPSLGLFDFNGSKANNIVWDGIGTHNFTPFKDANPEAPPEARYKALARGPGGLYAFQSPDGIRWKLMQQRPVIVRGAFDSQNLAFYDPHAGLYREYHRAFRNGLRDIMTGTSKDFLHWSEPRFLQYPGAPREHLYTNAVMPYPRAPHILVGFPTRFLPQRGQQTEPTFMSSRDGVRFHRWKEPLIPVTAPRDRDGNRCNYMAWGLVQLPGDPQYYSCYATEAYYTGPDSRLRRFRWRVDGFVSLHAGAEGGRMVTRLLRFSGDQLEVNFRTQERGSVRIGLQRADGSWVPGYSLTDCKPLVGDAVDHVAQWSGGEDVSSLAGQPVRMVVQLQNADFYSFRFRSSR